jgi:hypothetical protein
MRKLVFAAVFLFTGSFAAPAFSATKWIASYGSGSTCTRSAPCASVFDAAVASMAGDTIRCVDPGEYGNVFVGIPISISCEHVDAIVQTMGYSITPANSSTVVEGVTFDCNALPNYNGITFSGAGTFIVRNVKIRNCINGISFTPNGAAKLLISNTTITNNLGVGVLIQPTGSTTAQIEIDGLRAVNNQGGVYIQASGGTTLNFDMRNSVLSENSNYGLVSNSSGGLISAFVDTTSVSENANIGLYSSGANSYLLVNKSTIARNNIGWAFASGGTLATYSNNVVNSLSAFGGPSVTVGLQ